MENVAIYVRSSKDLHNVSCKAQEDELKKLVKDNGEVVYKVFLDEALSSTRDQRPAFEEMVSLAKSPNSPFGKIYCLDLARFGRDRNETQTPPYRFYRFL